VSAPGSYWSTTNTPVTYASALQYIGEAVWNQSGSVSGGTDLWATGGGSSSYFAKPAWQLVVGVLSDGRRDVPDVALNASSIHDPYLIYSSDGNPGSTLEGIGGTSAAAPGMAAIAALVTQQQNGRVGNFNPALYGLSGLQANAGAAVFHRITSGNNTVPGQTGFSASSTNPLYNLASGLGSVDAGMLITHWNDFSGSTAGLSPTTVVVPATASVGSATLILPPTTPWVASIGSGSTWLGITPASGTGSTPLTYSAAANPTQMARTGTIMIDGQTLTVTQAAAAGATAQLSPSLSSLGFGADQVGTSSSQMELISNTGGLSLTLGAISITGTAQADFTLTGTCVTGLVLVSGASCYLSVSFDPAVAGARSAILHIGSTSIALSGTGMTGQTSGDGPLPLWSYVALGAMLAAIGARRQRKLS
jgi:hypothetical protein